METVVSWLSAFVDFEATAFEAGVSFWSAVTGFAVSEPRGPGGEFATLVPPDGDDYLRVQRLTSGPTRIHLDLSVTNSRAAADRAVAAGAREVSGAQTHVILTSPGGLVFCFVEHAGERRPTPAQWSTGLSAHRSGVYQVCIDIGSQRYDEESAFWASTLGLPPRYWLPVRSSRGCGPSVSSHLTYCSSAPTTLIS